MQDRCGSRPSHRESEDGRLLNKQCEKNQAFKWKI